MGVETSRRVVAERGDTLKGTKRPYIYSGQMSQTF